MDEFALPPPSPDELALQLEGLDSSTDTDDGRRPIFSPQGNLSSTAMFQIEVASELQAKSDPKADDFLAGIHHVSPVKEEETLPGEVILPGEIMQRSVSSAENGSMASANVDAVVGLTLPADIPQMAGVSVSSSTEVKQRIIENKENVSPRLPMREIPKRKSAEITELKDFSDPLHNYQKSKDESIFDSSVALTEHKLKRPHQFRKALDGIILSFSPYFKLEIPYLETETGSKCELRKYFPEQVYWSKLLDSDNANRGATKNRSSADLENLTRHSKLNIEILPAHPLILTQLDNPASDKNVQVRAFKLKMEGFLKLGKK